MDYNKIKLVIWDLDETFWEGTLSEGVVLTPENHITLIKGLTDCGIINSICSKNNESEVISELDKLGLQDYFVFKSINWEPKGQRVASLIKNMSLRPENVLFIDDNHQNLKEVEFYNEGIMASDPSIIPGLIEFISQSVKKDLDHKRLKQYHVLQTKFEESQSYSDNESFLRSCGIHIQFYNDCLENIDRLHELLLRTNQLNFTKRRPSKKEFEQELKQQGARSGYVKVHDRFGDYGIVGFFLVKDNKLCHFLFSCRTIGQGVEQYVFAKLGFPQLDIIAPVATQLDRTSCPDWITEGAIISEDSPVKKNDIKVLFKGPCDMQGMVGYLQLNNQVQGEYTFTTDAGVQIETHNHSAHIYGLGEWNESTKYRLEEECFFFEKGCYKSNIYSSENNLIFLSTLTEGIYGLYRNKNTNEVVAYGHYIYPVTERENWSLYLEGKVPTYGVHITLEDLVSFSELYEYAGRRKPSDYVKFLSYLCSKLPEKTILCLILGTETPYLRNNDPSYKDRELYHKELNKAIRQFSEDNRRIRLIAIDSVLKSQSDFAGNINHYVPAVYYKLSLQMSKIIKDVSDSNVVIKSNKLRYLLKQYLQPYFAKLLPPPIYIQIRNLGRLVAKK